MEPDPVERQPVELLRVSEQLDAEVLLLPEFEPPGAPIFVQELASP